MPAEAAATGAPPWAAVAPRYRLRRGGRFRGGLGGRRGLGAGGGQDFVDFRDYAPGDDLRHLDWRGFARSDQLRVRLFEQETAPAGDVLVDLSASMAATEPKRRALGDLARLFAAWIAGEGGAPRWLALGGGAVPDPEAAECAGAMGLAVPRVPLRARGVRVVLSDCLDPGDLAAALRRLAVGAARFVVVQLLDPWERDPAAGGATTLHDCESGQRLELQLDARTVAAYRQRLLRLQASVRAVTAGLGGAFAEVLAAPPDEMCRRHLLPAGIVEPRP